MPCRYYYWAVILLLVHCASIFHRKSDFEKGIDHYRASNYSRAAKFFVQYYEQYPHSDTTLYYLYDCYNKLDQISNKIKVLEQFVRIGSDDINVYTSLFYQYRAQSQYSKLFELILGSNSLVEHAFNEKYILTRRLYAELVTGATAPGYSRPDPVVFAVSQGYLPIFLDGKFYDNDTITTGNLIILLDDLVEPFYPHNFYDLRYISNHSFLYLPYMRLIDLGILPLDPGIKPETPARLSLAAKAIARLRNKSLLHETN